MATRILITDLTGFPLASLDGHHGADHAARWAETTRAMLAADGVETMLFEVTPTEGGDAYRLNVLQQLGRIRFQFHKRPDGRREIVGAMITPSPGRAGAAAIPREARIVAHIVDAPESIHGARRPIRIPRGRQNQQGPATAADRRLARRLERANSRGAQ